MFSGNCAAVVNLRGTSLSMARAVTIFLAVLLLAYLAMCAAMFAYQRSFIYFPQPNSGGGPATTLNFQVKDAELASTTRQTAGPKAIIYFGGQWRRRFGQPAVLLEAFPGARPLPASLPGLWRQ